MHVSTAREQRRRIPIPLSTFRDEAHTSVGPIWRVCPPPERVEGSRRGAARRRQSAVRAQARFPFRQRRATPRRDPGANPPTRRDYLKMFTARAATSRIVTEETAASLSI